MDRFAIAFVSAAALACALEPFTCEDDAQCRRDGTAGQCLSPGFCAYPDPACDSGLRFSPDAAGTFARACVEDEAGTSGPLPAETTDGIAGSGDEETSAGESSDTGVLATCGNEMVEGDEECDDGNAARADGCNPDCRRSGVLVHSFESNLPGADVATDLVLLENGDVVIAGSEDVPEEDWDIVVTRYDADGGERWSVRRAGTGNLSDRARTIATTANGSFLVGGWTTPAASQVTPRGQLWMTEIDGDGNVLWDAVQGDPPPSHDLVWDIVALPDGDFVVVGRIDTINLADFLVRRYSPMLDGESFTLTEVWSHVVQGVGDDSDWGFAGILDGQGRLVAAGATHPDAVDIDRYLETVLVDGTLPRPACRDDGSDADDRVVDGNDQIRGLALAPDGHIAAVGLATKTDTDGTDAWVGYYAPDCALAWQRTVPGDAQDRDEGLGVAVDEDGFIVTVGFLRASNSEDLWVAKWNDAGDMAWQAELLNGPGDGEDVASAVVIGPDAEIVVAGYVSKPDGADVWVGRYTP